MAGQLEVPQNSSFTSSSGSEEGFFSAHFCAIFRASPHGFESRLPVDFLSPR